jgi:hypothetical protein
VNWKLIIEGNQEAVAVTTLYAQRLADTCLALDGYLRARLKYGELCEEAREELEAARGVLRNELGFLQEVVLDV